ncbi:hypothetical protein HD884_002102 [Ochrobactrum intermedium]|nr:hypothetical protein [Brucella intermedia]
MAQKKNPWSDPDLVREKDTTDPSPVEPRDHQEKPTHEQTNAPGNPNIRVPKEPYPDRSKD